VKTANYLKKDYIARATAASSKILTLTLLAAGAAGALNSDTPYSKVLFLAGAAGISGIITASSYGLRQNRLNAIKIEASKKNGLYSIGSRVF
jgi:hypothetical protein